MLATLRNNVGNVLNMQHTSPNSKIWDYSPNSRRDTQTHNWWPPTTEYNDVIMNGHYNEVIMSAMGSQITGLRIVYSTVYSGADQRKHQSSASPDFVRGIHRWPMNSPHKGPVTRKMFPFDEVIMEKTVICGWLLVAHCFCIANIAIVAIMNNAISV